jgi:hypothetical protein
VVFEVWCSQLFYGSIPDAALLLLLLLLENSRRKQTKTAARAWLATTDKEAERGAALIQIQTSPKSV